MAGAVLSDLAQAIDEHGIDVELRRPVTNFGETNYPNDPTASVRVVRRIGAPSRIPGDEGGRAYTQAGLIYVYRDTDIRDGDKVKLPEGDFIVRGGAENDQVNPLDGHDFGVKRYNVERG
ncbi:MAG: hypothetical protein AB1925_12525 [Actinomycetota bacterium]